MGLGGPRTPQGVLKLDLGVTPEGCLQVSGTSLLCLLVPSRSLGP